MKDPGLEELQAACTFLILVISAATAGLLMRKPRRKPYEPPRVTTRNKPSHTEQSS